MDLLDILIPVVVALIFAIPGTLAYVNSKKTGEPDAIKEWQSIAEGERNRIKIVQLELDRAILELQKLRIEINALQIYVMELRTQLMRLGVTPKMPSIEATDANQVKRKEE